MQNNDNSEKTAHEFSEEIDELNKKVDVLEAKVTKLEAIDTKMAKIEENSDKIAKNTELLVAESNRVRAAEIAKGTIYSPSGFVAKEMTGHLIKSLDKYNKTNFRRWLATSGGTVVEKSIEAYVNSKVPQMNWYDSKCTETGPNTFHYSSRASFPFELNTGVPFVGRITLTKVNADVHTDVNTTTKETTNTKCNFLGDQASQKIFGMLKEDLNNSLKPHKKTYKVLSPFGRGLNKAWIGLRSELTFSIPLAIMFVFTFLFPGTWPAIDIYRMIGIPYIGGFWNLTGTTLLCCLINGVLYGAVIWAILRFHVIGNIRRGIGKIARLRKQKDTPKMSPTKPAT